MNDINLKQIIEQFPDCITNGAKLKAILLDTYPEISKAIVNTLVIMANSGIAKEIQDSENITELDESRWHQKLEDEGLSGKAIEACFNLLMNKPLMENVSISPNTIKTESISKTIQVGQTIEFGSYWQDNDKSMGKTPIEWRVLAKNESKALLISEFALDRKPFNSNNEAINWKASTLRLWLNSDFLNSAFSTTEQDLIQTTCIVGDKNPKYNTYFNYEVNDKVFLLSIDEAEKYFNKYEDLRCIPTEYSKPIGIALTNRMGYTKNGKYTCMWWLRSPGSYLWQAAIVGHGGDIDFDGQNVKSAGYYCVRPALWVELDA